MSSHPQTPDSCSGPISPQKLFPSLVTKIEPSQIPGCFFDLSFCGGRKWKTKSFLSENVPHTSGGAAECSYAPLAMMTCSSESRIPPIMQCVQRWTVGTRSFVPCLRCILAAWKGMGLLDSPRSNTWVFLSMAYISLQLRSNIRAELR